jgi:hypothetical protein
VKEPVWLLKEVILVLHDQLLADFGGACGRQYNHGVKVAS